MISRVACFLVQNAPPRGREQYRQRLRGWLDSRRVRSCIQDANGERESRPLARSSATMQRGWIRGSATIRLSRIEKHWVTACVPGSFHFESPFSIDGNIYRYLMPCRRQVCAVVKAERKGTCIYMYMHTYIYVKMSIYNRCSVSMDAEAARRLPRRAGEKFSASLVRDLLVEISFPIFLAPASFLCCPFEARPGEE